jgi:hypothetical protein
MDSQFARPVSDFPQFWYACAGIFFLVAIYMAFSGYRRYHGNLFLMECIFLLIYKLIKGKKKSNEIEQQMIKDTKWHKIYGDSGMIGAIWFLLFSILSLYGVKFLIAK